MTEEMKLDIKGMIANLAITLLELNRKVKALEGDVERFNTIAKRIEALENYVKVQTEDD